MKNLIIIFLCSFFLVDSSIGQIYTNSVVPLLNPGPNVGVGTNNPLTLFHIEGMGPVSEVRFEQTNFSMGSNNGLFGPMSSGAFGDLNEIYGGMASFGIGNSNLISGSNIAISIGDNNEIQAGDGSVAIGTNNYLEGQLLFAIGRGIQSINNNTAITIGEDVVNNFDQSFMVGFSGTSNLFVDGSSGFTGLNTTSPQQVLDVNGTIRASSLSGIGNRNVCANANGDLIISGPCGGSLADNLGDHIATKTLNMSCFDIEKTGNINFCNGISLNQSLSNTLVIEGGPVGIKMDPSTAPFGPHMLAVNGSIFGTGLYITSDKKFKKNIQQLPNSLNNVMKINGYNYDYDSSNNDFDFEAGRTHGFIAQELQEVYPELVRDEGEFLSVNYVGLIPVLTEAIKEQQSIIESNALETKELKKEIKGQQNIIESNALETKELRDEIKELKSMVNSICSSGCGDIGMIQSSNLNQTEGTDKMKLIQNSPNPFNSITTIQFYLPQESKNAALYIYDLQGRQIENFDISERGNGKIEINASDLPSGMYYYGLLVDGKTSPPLKMILTD